MATNKKMAATQAPSFYFFLRGLLVQDQNSTSCVLVLFSSRRDEFRPPQVQRQLLRQ
jgi:hypothetical protein